MARTFITPLILAGAAAAAIFAAPAAGAGTSTNCDDDGPAAVCTRNGHAAIYATPNAGVPQYAISPGGGNPFGYGPVPPMLAMD